MNTVQNLIDNPVTRLSLEEKLHVKQLERPTPDLHIVRQSKGGKIAYIIDHSTENCKMKTAGYAAAAQGMLFSLSLACSSSQMHILGGFESTVKEKMSDRSFVHNEENLPIKREHIVKEEPVDTFVPIKVEAKKNESVDNNTELKTELHDKVKEDHVFHECVKQELNFQYFASNLRKSLQGPLAINDNDIKNIKKEYSYSEDKNEEHTTVVQGKWQYEDIKYKTDIDEHNVGSYVDNDPTVTSISEDSIPCSSSTENNIVSKADQDVHKQIKYNECDVCYKTFYSSQSLKRHINSVHKGIKRYECDNCLKNFSTVQSVKEHIETMHRKNKKYECNICYKSYSQVSSLKIHINTKHRRIKNANCKECQKTFSYAVSLKRHVDSVHKAIRKYSCKECPKKFSAAQSLKVHIDTMHREINKYECHDCCKIFSYVSSLKRHINDMHKGTGNSKYCKFECSNCCKQLSNARKLRIHIDSVHKRNENYECYYCNKKFFYARSLKLHIDNVHKQIKNYECYDCHKKIFSAHRFKVHIDSVHKRIRNYECNICYQKFSTKEVLKLHIDTVHTIIKNFECKDCCNLYSQASSLKRHINIFHK